MEDFKKLHEDVQEFLNRSESVFVTEQVGTIAENFDVESSDIMGLTIGELLEEVELQEAIGAAVIGATALAVGIKKLRKELEAKRLGCSKMEGEGKSQCIFKAQLDELKKRQGLYTRAKNACTTESCKRSADKSIKTIDGQIKELLKKSR